MSNDISRLEVIDATGRVYLANPCSVRFDTQDGGRTLKVFVSIGEAAVPESPRTILSAKMPTESPVMTGDSGDQTRQDVHRDTHDAPTEGGWRRTGEKEIAGWPLMMARWVTGVEEGAWVTYVPLAVEQTIASRARAEERAMWVADTTVRREAEAENLNDWIEACHAAETRITTLERERERMETALREALEQLNAQAGVTPEECGDCEMDDEDEVGVMCDLHSTIATVRRALTGSQEDENG